MIQFLNGHVYLKTYLFNHRPWICTLLCTYFSNRYISCNARSIRTETKNERPSLAQNDITYGDKTGNSTACE